MTSPAQHDENRPQMRRSRSWTPLPRLVSHRQHRCTVSGPKTVHTPVPLAIPAMTCDNTGAPEPVLGHEPELCTVFCKRCRYAFYPGITRKLDRCTACTDFSHKLAQAGVRARRCVHVTAKNAVQTVQTAKNPGNTGESMYLFTIENRYICLGGTSCSPS